MNIGTKSVLFGAHCFFLHPWFVALAWWKLYGFPWDPRLWLCFFVHDIGYWGKPNMDGKEGELHPFFGAGFVSFFCDGSWPGRPLGKWGMFCLLHSRYLAKSLGEQPSQLCFADKLSFALTPRWLYLPLVNATGEIREYLKNAQKADSGHWKPTGYDQKLWHAQLCDYMTRWVDEHKGGAADTWTDAKRHANEAGVWK
jgi:hypothetical protein